MVRKRIIAGIIFLLFVTGLFGFIRIDDDPIKRIEEQLSNWTTNYSQEKVYLHLDKPYYAAGDDIWFKAYITIGGKHQLSALSGVLNVELINDKDSVEKAIKLPVVKGLAWGDFALPDTMKTGNYRIRAYTNWMRNYDPEYFFDKTIIIGNSTDVFAKAKYVYSTENGKQKADVLINYADFNGKPIAVKNVTYSINDGDKRISEGKGITDEEGNLKLSFVEKTASPLKADKIITYLKLDKRNIATKIISLKEVSVSADVQFFPESGTLVNGIRSKLAFKAVGSDGSGVDIKGVVTDNENHQVATFSSQHLGMGVFYLSPRKGKIYKALITYPDGTQNTVSLPQSVNSGFVLAIDNQDTANIKITIDASHNLLNSSQDNKLTLVAQSGGQIYYAAKNKLNSTLFTASIPKSKFPPGIVQFTLFSSAGEPLNERIAFIQPGASSKIAIETDKQTYTARMPVNISFKIDNDEGDPAIGSFSAAVINESEVPFDEDDDNAILSDLLLTSDLKGFIQKPAYYFNKDNEKSRSDLDVLMLTQGYRRFEWKQLLSDNFPDLKYQPEKRLGISGHVYALDGKPIAGAKVFLLNNKGILFTRGTLTDAFGRFTFDKPISNDITYTIQAKNLNSNKKVKLILDDEKEPATSSIAKFESDQNAINGNLEVYLKHDDQYQQQQVIYGMNQNSGMLKEVKVKRKKLYIPHNTPPGEQVIFMKNLPKRGVTLASDLDGVLPGVMFQNGKAYSTSGKVGNDYFPFTLIIDGLVAEDGDLNGIPAESVSSVVVSGRFIMITSKLNDIARQPDIANYTPQGYYKARAFYSPKYDDPSEKSIPNDLRTTIYWNPNIISDKDGKASFHYFNADTKGTYRVTIEGIDADGNLHRLVQRYKVE